MRSKKEEYGDSYARYTDPQMGPEDDRGRSYKPHHRRATNLEKIGFAMSIAALICCCCANIYLTLGVSIMSLAVLICSRFLQMRIITFTLLQLLELLSAASLL